MVYILVFKNVIYLFNKNCNLGINWRPHCIGPAKASQWYDVGQTDSDVAKCSESLDSTTMPDSPLVRLSGGGGFDIS